MLGHRGQAWVYQGRLENSGAQTCSDGSLHELSSVGTPICVMGIVATDDAVPFPPLGLPSASLVTSAPVAEVNSATLGGLTRLTAMTSAYASVLPRVHSVGVLHRCLLRGGF